MSAEVNVQLITPASTPGEQDGRRYLARLPDPGYKDKWTSSPWTLVPVCMLFISALQVAAFVASNETTTLLLRLDPALRWQTWRYLSYMLLHWSGAHLALNVALQCLLVVPLEVEQGWIRATTVYVAGGVLGAIGASVLRPALRVVGASAGVYALLLSHLAHLYLNFQSVKFKIYRLFSVCVLAGSDIAFYVFHTGAEGNPPISLEAHAAGALGGFVLGLAAYRVLHGGAQGHRLVSVVASRVALGLLVALSVLLLAFLPDGHFRNGC